jgi:hypothetical protein
VDPSTWYPGLCPRCENPVEPEWRFCPNCEAVLQGSERGSLGGKQDQTLRRALDLPKNPLAGVLAAIGLVGLIPIGAVAGGVASRLIGTSATGACVIGLASAVIICICVYCWLWDRPIRRGMEAVLVGALALAGVLLILSCAMGGLVLLVVSAFR